MKNMKIPKDVFKRTSRNISLDLKEDMPCPVCGSTYHPNLAHLQDDAPTKTVLNKMKANTSKLLSIARG